MPTQETKFRIFLSSPSDLNDERNAVQAVVDELNKTWGEANNASVVLVSWEKSMSGFADEPQAVIDAAVGENWDVYLGLMYTRFGTPTKSFGSGTEEEFENAYKLWGKDKAGRRLLFYFKTEAINPFSIDLDQFKKVKEFRDKISGRGGLHGSFGSSADLSGFLRIQLSRVFGELLKNYKKQSPLDEIVSHEQIATLDFTAQTEMWNLANGILGEANSLITVFNEHGSVMKKMVEVLVEENVDIGKTDEVDDREALKDSEERIAKSFRDGAIKLSGIRVRYAESSRNYFDKLTRFISVNLQRINPELIEKFKTQIEKNLSSAKSWSRSHLKTQNRLESWPSVGQEFDQAKIALNSELKLFCEVVDYGANRYRVLLSLL